MKFILYIATLQTGGAERQTVKLANTLAGMGHSVLLVTNTIGAELEALVNADSTGVQRKALFASKRPNRLLSLVYSAVAFYRLRKQVLSFEPDILYSSLYASNVAACLALIGLRTKPLLAWSIRSERPKQKLIIQLWFKLCVLMSRRVDLIVSNSLAGLESHRRFGFSIDACFVFPNIIDTTQFLPALEETRSSDASTRIGMVGRIDRTKDIKLALQAYAIASRTINLSSLKITGPISDLDYLEELKLCVHELGLDSCVEWLGSVAGDKLVETYQSLDILLNTSYTEGFSNVLCEAMSCNVRCVATNVGDSARIVGATGETVRERKSDVIARCIVKLAQTPVLTVNSPRDHIISMFPARPIIDSFTGKVQAMVKAKRAQGIVV